MLTWLQEQRTAVDDAIRLHEGARPERIEELAKAKNDATAVAYWRKQFALKEIDESIKIVEGTTVVLPDGQQRITPHVKHICAPTCGGCPICLGDLKMCDVCGLAEGALTTDCPGAMVNGYLADAVQNRMIDYRNGQWVHDKAGPTTFVDPAPATPFDAVELTRHVQEHDPTALMAITAHLLEPGYD